MSCITIHSPILPRFPQPTTTSFSFMHQLTTNTATFRFPTNAASAALFQRCKTPAAAAAPSSLFLAAAVPPATSGDYTVMLQTGGLLFFMYLITNFLVPTMVFKDLKDEDGSDKDKEA